MKGYIMQLQPFSVNDGDGIRTTIFMAGCPLRCKWCANPEGFRAVEIIGWYKRKCIGCGACTGACPEGIGIDMNAQCSGTGIDMNAQCSGTGSRAKPGVAHGLERDRCIVCGRCVEVCPADARTRMVRLMDADDVLRQIQKHRLFYSYSGGGITFSGGEATSQPELLDYLTERIYDMGFSMDIETCGQFDWERTAPILARMDLIFMDLKLMDPDKHLEYTGISNDKILQNISNLAQLKDIAEDGKGPEIVIRIPVIGGVNDDDNNIRKSAAFVHEHLPEARMELLPYHRYGQIKYEALGMPYDHPEFSTPGKAEMDRLRDLVRAEGVEIADFR